MICYSFLIQIRTVVALNLWYKYSIPKTIQNTPKLALLIAKFLRASEQIGRYDSSNHIMVTCGQVMVVDFEGYIIIKYRGKISGRINMDFKKALVDL